MSRFPNERAQRFVILGNLENRRVQFFTNALHELGHPPPDLVSWLDFIRDPATLAAKLTPGCWLRIESPGENFHVEKAILAHGADEEDHLAFQTLSIGEIDRLQFEKGRILALRQWYLGWRKLLEQVEDCLAGTPGGRVMNASGAIAAMFDKARCHATFAEKGVPVPAMLGVPSCFEELLHLMEIQGCDRIFLKPCHSSSASGVVAFERGRVGQQAFSSVELVPMNGRVELFNSLKVRQYRTGGEIAALIDGVCRQRSLAEVWFPKAGLHGQRFDLRVLVIRGNAAHVVMRQSAGPITNLHLGNSRGDLAGLKARMGEDNWQAALSISEQAAAAFPDALYVAVDLLVAPSFRRYAVAEVNAFGDLLPNLHHAGMDTYTAQLRALTEWESAPSAVDAA